MRSVSLLAEAPAHYFDPLQFTRRQFSAAPQGRQINADLTVYRQTPLWGRIDLTASAVSEENNLVRSPLNVGLTSHWQIAF